MVSQMVSRTLNLLHEPVVLLLLRAEDDEAEPLDQEGTLFHLLVLRGKQADRYGPNFHCR